MEVSPDGRIKLLQERDSWLKLRTDLKPTKNDLKPGIVANRPANVVAMFPLVGAVAHALFEDERLTEDEVSNICIFVGAVAIADHR